MYVMLLLDVCLLSAVIYFRQFIGDDNKVIIAKKEIVELENSDEDKKSGKKGGKKDKGYKKKN